MSHVCYEGSCASGPKSFSTARGLRIHQYRSHSGDAEDETTLGNARALKRQRDAEDEVRKRQRLELEAQLALEAANCELEPQPVRFITYLLKMWVIFHSLDTIVRADRRHWFAMLSQEATTPCTFP